MSCSIGPKRFWTSEIFCALQMILGSKMTFVHGESDSTVVKRRQQQLGRMADFLPSVTFSVFDL